MRPARFHIAFAIVWLALAAAIAAGIAAAGSERRALERRLGALQGQAREAEARLERLRGELAWLASPPTLEMALRRLNLLLNTAEMARR